MLIGNISGEPFQLLTTFEAIFEQGSIVAAREYQHPAKTCECELVQLIVTKQ